jgi:hypothetical protein
MFPSVLFYLAFAAFSDYRRLATGNRHLSTDALNRGLTTLVTVNTAVNWSTGLRWTRLPRLFRPEGHRLVRAEWQGVAFCEQDNRRL